MINNENELENEGSERSLLYSHEGYDKSFIHACTIYHMNIIPSLTCFKSNPFKDTSHLFIYTENNVLKILNTITNEVIVQLNGHRSGIISVLSCNQDEIMTISQDGAINVWNPWDTNGLQWKNSLNRSRNNLTSFAVSESDHHEETVDNHGIIIATTKDGYLCAWNRTTSLSIHTSQLDSGGLYSSAICDDSNLLLLGGFGKLHVHEKNFHSLSHVTTLGGHSGPIFSTIAANGYVATGGEDKSIIVYNLNTFQQVSMCRNAHTSAVTALLHCQIPVPSSLTTSTSPIPSTYLISGGRDYYIHLWSFPILQRLHTISGHDGRITSLTLSQNYYKHQNRPALISCSADQTIKVWKIYRLLNWDRRRVFMMLLVHHRFIQMSIAGALARIINEPIEQKVDEGETKEISNQQRYLQEVFSNKGIIRVVMSFI